MRRASGVATVAVVETAGSGTGYVHAYKGSGRTAAGAAKRSRRRAAVGAITATVRGITRRVSHAFAGVIHAFVVVAAPSGGRCASSFASVIAINKSCEGAIHPKYA